MRKNMPEKHPQIYICDNNLQSYRITDFVSLRLSPLKHQKVKKKTKKKKKKKKKQKKKKKKKNNKNNNNKNSIIDIMGICSLQPLAFGPQRLQ